MVASDLFDGVWKKALFGMSAGVGLGFLPFIPGGPIVGGIVGAVAGAAFGMWGNYKKINVIKAQNQAFVAAIGVQPQTQQEADALLSGNLKQLYTPQQAADATQQGAAVQQGTAQQAPQDAAAAQQQAVAQQQLLASQQSNQAGLAAQQAAAANDQATATQQADQAAATQQADQAAATRQADQATAANTAAIQGPQLDFNMSNLPQSDPTMSAGGGADAAIATSAAAGGTVAQQAQARLDENEARMKQIWLNATPAQRKQVLDALLKQIQTLQGQITALQSALPQSGGATAATAGASQLAAAA